MGRFKKRLGPLVKKISFFLNSQKNNLINKAGTYLLSLFGLDCSVADPYRYHFDTDPDRGPAKNSLWIQTEL